MGQLAFGLGGAAIGGFLGGPFGASIGFSIGAAVGGLLFRPDGPTFEGPRLSDLTVPGSAEGTGIPIVRGTMRVPGKVIWTTSIVETRHEEEVEAEGGKGDPPSATQVSFTYSLSFAVSLCEAPAAGITGVRRIWADSKLVYSIADGADSETFNGNVAHGTIRFYNGAETQTPDSLIAATVGAANAEASRGTAYLVFDTWQLADFANHRPMIEAEVVVAGTNTSPVHTKDEVGYDWLRIAVDRRRAKVYLANGNFTAGQYVYRWSGGSDAPIAFARVPIDYTDINNIEVDEHNDELVAFRDAGLTGLFIMRWDASTGAHRGTHSLGPLGTPTTGAAEAIGFPSESHYDRVNRCFWTVGGGFNTGEAYLVKVLPSAGDAAVQSVANLGRVDSSFYNHTPLVDSDGSVWLCNNTFIVRTGSAPKTFTLPATGEQASSFLWKARGEIWIRRNTGHATFGWLVFNVTTQTFANSVDLSLGTWTTATVDGVENSVGQAWFVVNADIDLTLRNPDGTEVASLNNTAFGGGSMRYMPGVVIRENATQAVSFFENSLGVAGIPLSNLVADLCALCGVNSVTASSLASDSVRGYLVAEPIPVRGALEPLMGAFSFDAVEHDGGLAFVKRGGASVATLSENDLGAHTGDSSEVPESVTITRSLESELPASVYLRFANQDLDYNVGVARARRLVSDAQNVSQVDFPIAFTSAEANVVADRIMRYAWLERERFEFALAPKWRKLEPTDIVTLPDGQRVRITNIDYIPSGPVRCQAVSDDAGALVSYAVGNAAEVGTGVTLEIAGPTTGIVLDLPLLVDAHDDEALYVGASGEKASWTGATVYYSRDGGLSWLGATPTMTAARIGAVVSGAMAAGPVGARWDHASLITVKLIQPGQSITTPASLEAFYHGANAFAISADGEDWEIVQAYTVTSNADGTYALKDFLRGRKGTEHLAQAWTTGARIVFLDAGAIKRVRFPLSALATESLWKAVGFGTALPDAAIDEETFDAVSAIPYAPVEVGGAKQASGDFQLRWTRRARKDHEWRNGADVPLDEATELYDVEILDEDFAAVKRTLSIAAATTTTYTNAQATADFGSTPTAIAMRVYQVSARVGRGYVGQAVVGREVATALRWDGTKETAGLTLSASGLTCAKNAVNAVNYACGTRYVREGRHYFEVRVDAFSGVSGAVDIQVGVTKKITLAQSPPTAGSDLLARSDGALFGGSGGFNYGAAGDVIMVALDCDGGRVYWGLNGTWQNSADPATSANPQATFTPGDFWTAEIGGTDPNTTTWTMTGRFSTGHSHAVPVGFVPFY